MSKPQSGPRWLSNPTSRPAQWRLLLLVLALGLTLISMREARQPDRWRWLWAGDGRRPAVADRPRTAARPRVASATQERLPTGVFQSPVAPSSPSTGQLHQLLPGIDREALAAVQDDTVFRPAERDAWFNLFGVLRAHDPQQLEQASTGNVGYLQLFEQPDHYRGQLVTIRGQVRRVLFRSAPKNAIGIDGYYQVVLRPADGPNSPLIVYCLDLPEGFPSGEGIREDVTVTCLFFKNWAFATRDDIRSSPTLLARTLNWLPPAPVAVRTGQMGQLVAMVVATAIASVLIATWIVRRSNRLTAAHRRPPADPATVAESELEAKQVAAGLQRLAGSEPEGFDRVETE